MLTYLWVAIGGALGSVARFWVNGLIWRTIRRDFSLGHDAHQYHRVIHHRHLRVADRNRKAAGWRRPRRAQFLMTGICGGYTTFSSFSLQTLNLAHEGEWFSRRAISCCRSCFAWWRCGSARCWPSSSTQ